MAHTSPLANPQPFIDTVNRLSEEGIIIDRNVDNARRDAQDFATKYAADFQIIIELRTSTEEFSIRWVAVLQRTRDASSAIAVFYRRFIAVFLSLIGHIHSLNDVKDVITEFNSFLGEGYPSRRFDLDQTTGVKTAFEEIEALVSGESRHIIDVLEKANTSPDWETIVHDLDAEIDPVKAGSELLRQALVSYATRLE